MVTSKKELYVVNIKNVEPYTDPTKRITGRSYRCITKANCNSDKLMLTVFCADPGQGVKPMSTSRDECMYIIKGRCKAIWNDKEIFAKKGDAVFIPAAEKISLQATGKGRLVCVAVISPPIV